MIRAVILGTAWLASLLSVWYLGYVLGYSDGRVDAGAGRRIHYSGDLR